MREQIDHARLRAVVQGIIDKDKSVEVFEEYMKIAFPWLESANKKEQMQHINRLLAEIGQGPISITRMDGGGQKVKSRLRTRIEKRAEPVTRDTNKLYDKLGQYNKRR